MLSSVLLLLVGLATLIGGGYLVVEGASSVTRALGVSPLAVGLTVVAFGTSAPELAVNLTAVIEGKTEIAFGNVIGSNIVNIGLIVGVTALIRGLQINSQLLGRELPIMLLSTAVAVVMALDPLIRDTPAMYDRGDGLLLLLFFGIFLFGSLREIVGRKDGDTLLAASSRIAPRLNRRSLTLSAGFCILGLGALGAGAELAVRGASRLAAIAGVPLSVVGATVVALGTSLPELVTSLVAALRREADLAVGNVVGSNIFNLAFILGVTAVVRPLPVPSSGLVDLAILAVLSLLLLLFSVGRKRRVTRLQGTILLLSWIGYAAGRLSLPGL